MKRTETQHYGLIGALFLLGALMLALAIPGIAGAKTRIVPRELVPDVTAPVTTDNSATIQGYRVSLDFTADDGVDGSGVEATYYRADGGQWMASSSLLISQKKRHKATGFARGQHAFEYYSVDLLGNVESVKTCVITLP